MRFHFKLTTAEQNKTDYYPFPPYIYITPGDGFVENGIKYLSPQLVNDLEIDESIQHLKDDLDLLASRLKKELRCARSAHSKYIASRSNEPSN